jgi:hypothetical protein
VSTRILNAIKSRLKKKIDSIPRENSDIDSAAPPKNTHTIEELSKFFQRVADVTGYKSAIMTSVINMLMWFYNNQDKNLDDYLKVEQGTISNPELLDPAGSKGIDAAKSGAEWRQELTKLTEKKKKEKKQVRLTVKEKASLEIKKKKEKETRELIQLKVSMGITELKKSKSELTEDNIRNILNNVLTHCSSSDPDFFKLESTIMHHCIDHKQLGLFAEFYAGSKNPSKSLDSRLNETFKNFGRGISLTKYLMTTVAINPNTLVDIVSRQDIKLFSEQKEFVWLCYNNIVKNGPNIILSAPTSWGKSAIATALIRFSPNAEILRKKIGCSVPEITVLFIVPNSAVGIQLGAMINISGGVGLAPIRISMYLGDIVYTTNDPTVIIGTAKSLLKHYPMLFEIAKKRTIVTICDEIHMVNVNENYANIVLKMVKITKNVIALSATIPNIEELCHQMEIMYERPCISLIAGSRPVRIDYFKDLKVKEHCWSGLSDDNKYSELPYLSPCDLSQVLDVLDDIDKGGNYNNLYEQLSSDKLTLLQCDKVTDKLKGIMQERKINISTLFPKLPDADLSIDNLISILNHTSKNGNTILATPDAPEDLCNKIHHNLRTKMEIEYPFIDDLMILMHTLYARRIKEVTKLSSASFQEGKAPAGLGSDKKDKAVAATADRELNSSLKAATNIEHEWKTGIEKLLKNYTLPKQQKILADYYKRNIYELTDNYEIPEEYKFGNDGTKFVSTSDMGKVTYQRNVSPHTKKMFANKIYFIKESDALVEEGGCPSVVMVKILKLFQEKKIGVLVFSSRLSIGMNLPARNAVIYDPDGKFTSTALKQIAGRAGRKGLDKSGNVYQLTKPGIKKELQNPVVLF